MPESPLRDYGLLVRAAIDALAMSHPMQPPALRFGAAVLTASGRMHSAAVFWSATSTLTLHAEHAALSRAACEGERDIVAIACASSEDAAGRAYCHPCGICRQLIYESALFSGREIDVVMANLQGGFKVAKIADLVPDPWPMPARASKTSSNKKARMKADKKEKT